MTARIVVLGSADAFSSGGRGNTAWLLEDGIAPCTVDFGPTALVALKLFPIALVALPNTSRAPH